MQTQRTLCIANVRCALVRSAAFHTTVHAFTLCDCHVCLKVDQSLSGFTCNGCRFIHKFLREDLWILSSNFKGKSKEKPTGSQLLFNKISVTLASAIMSQCMRNNHISIHNHPHYFEPLNQTYCAKSRDISLLFSKNCVSLASDTLSQYTHVTNRWQTKRQITTIATLCNRIATFSWEPKRMAMMLAIPRWKMQSLVQQQIRQMVHIQQFLEPSEPATWTDTHMNATRHTMCYCTNQHFFQFINTISKLLTVIWLPSFSKNCQATGIKYCSSYLQELPWDMSKTNGWTQLLKQLHVSRRKPTSVKGMAFFTDASHPGNPPTGIKL